MKEIWSNRLKTRNPTKKHAVYSIQNIITKKIYFGYTEEFKRRMNEHKNISKKKRIPKVNLLYQDMKELGFDSFEFKLLKEFESMQEALEYEKTLMNQHSPDMLYNKQKYNKGTWKGSKKPKQIQDEISKLITEIINTQLKINLILLEKPQ